MGQFSKYEGKVQKDHVRTKGSITVGNFQTIENVSQLDLHSYKNSWPPKTLQSQGAGQAQYTRIYNHRSVEHQSLK